MWRLLVSWESSHCATKWQLALVSSKTETEYWMYVCQQILQLQYRFIVMATLWMVTSASVVLR